MGCGTTRVREGSGVVMGTSGSMRLYGAEEADIETLWSLVRTLENKTLSRRVEGSEVWKVNQAPVNTTIELSEKLTDYLQVGEEVSEKSEGTFDLSLGNLITLWNIDAQVGEEQPVLPTQEEIEKNLEQVGMKYVSLEGTKLVKQESVCLDLGAVGKGIALDEIKVYLEQRKGIQGAIVSLGGSVLTYGNKPDATAYKVAIVNPQNTGETIGFLSLTGSHFVSTSGGYERYIELNNKRYHHILDPRTGYPSDSDVLSVTIVSDSGYLSDALSTACFVLGKEKGLKLAGEYQAQILFVMKDGSIEMSSDMEPLFTAK